MAVRVNISEGTVYGDLNVKYFPAHMNFGRVFLERTLEYGNKIALIDGETDEQISFAEMAQKIVNVAHSLVQLGVKEGETVAICSENRIEFIITAVAVLYAGAVVTFINYAYNHDEIIHVAKISKPKYVFVSNDTYKVHYNTLKELDTIKQIFMFGKDKGRGNFIRFEELAEKSIEMAKYEGANFYGRAHTGLILYSSGTTGLPKGAKLTHLNYITTTYQVPVTLRPVTMMSVAPFSHTMGFQNLCISLVYGKTVVFLNKFTEDSYFRSIEKYKVIFILAAPTTVVTLCKSLIADKYDLSSLEFMHCGGAPLERETMEEAKARFPKLSCVMQGYGMTETSGVISRETDNNNGQRFGSVGKVVAGIIIKVVDIESRKPLKPNQLGELCVKGPGVFEEYIGISMDEYTEEGFLKTGDIGYYDEDGFIYVVDRLKELIKYKAWQVPPSELEAILLKHPKVLDAAVLGKPDKLAGELPTAFIVRKPGLHVTEQEIVDFLNSKVSPWKRLRGGVRFVEEIPKNPSGKILRRLLREALIKPTSKL